MNGQQCKFAHPAKCIKFCRYGNDSDRGCSGGCNQLHPTLCKNSIEFKSCPLTNCTLTHLVGTQRGTEWNFPNTIKTKQFFSDKSFPVIQNDNINTVHRYAGYNEPSNPVNFPTKFNRPITFQTLTSENVVPYPNPNNYHVDQLTDVIKQLKGSVDSLLEKDLKSYSQPPSSRVNFSTAQGGVNRTTFSDSNFPPFLRNNTNAMLNIPKNYPPQNPIHAKQQ